MARIYYIDNLRACLMSMGIILHCGYVADLWFTGYVDYVSGLFRMNLFMLVSGYFAALHLTKRSKKDFKQARLITLGLPALVALLLLNPVTNYVFYSAHGGTSHFLAFLSERTELDANTPVINDWILHGWFLIALIFYTAMIGVFDHLAGRPWARKGVAFLRKQAYGPVVTYLSLGFFVAGLCTCLQVYFRLTFGLIVSDENLTRLLLHLFENSPYFLLGLLAFRQPALMRVLQTINWVALAGGITALLALEYILPELRAQLGTFVPFVLRTFLKAFVGFTLCSVLLTLFARFADHGNRALRFLSSASYTVYLFHFLMISVIGLMLQSLGAGDWMRYFATMPLAFAICLVLHGVLVQKTALGALLFNGKHGFIKASLPPTQEVATPVTAARQSS